MKGSDKLDNYDYLKDYIEECTFLSKEQLIGENCLLLFYTIGLECNTTDFARGIGGVEDSNATRNHPETNNYYGEYALRDIDYKTNPSIYFQLTTISSIGVHMPYVKTRRDFFIRPVLRVKSMVPFLPLIERDNSNHLILKLGSYPSTIENNQIRLESLFQENKIPSEEEYYLIDNEKEPVYKYKKKYYVRAAQYYTKVKYSNGITCQDLDKPLWFIIEPITWYVDLENKLLISKNLITSNTSYSTFYEKDRPQKFEDTILYEYLNETLLKKIFMMNKKLSNKKNIEDLEDNNPDIKPNKMENNRSIFKIDYGKKINEKLRKIEEICQYIPEKTKEIIIRKTNKILEEYKKNVEYMKPTMNRKIRLSTKITNIKEIEPIFLGKLDQIIILSTPLKELSDKEKDILEYKALLLEEVKRVELTNTTKSKISNILFYSNKLDETEQKQIKKELSEYINIYEKNLQEVMHHFVTDEIELDINQNYQENFNKKIDSLYEEIMKEIKEISPLINLRDILMSNKIEWKETNSLSNFLSSIRYDISRISIKKYRDEYETEFNKIIDKYLYIVNKIMHSKKTNEYTIHGIEIGLRRELNSLLNSILKRSQEIDTNNKYRFKNKLLTQIINGIGVLNGTISERSKQNIDYEVITSKTQDINNKYFKGTYLNIEELNEYKDNLIKKLEEQKEIYKEKEIYSLEEYYDSLYEILHILSKFELDISNFLDDYKDHKEIPQIKK